MLKDIEIRADGNRKAPTVLLKDCEIECVGNILNPDFIKGNFTKDSKGLWHVKGEMLPFDFDNIEQYWKTQVLYEDLRKLFIHRLSTEERLKSSNALVRNEFAIGNPIYKICCDEKKAKLISDYFYKAFGVEVVVDRSELIEISLHVGNAPDKAKFTMNMQDEYYRLVSELPKLQEQGDGMRSFASILLNICSSDYSVILIDEPEAFLHPPQARLLGKILAAEVSNNQQLFISTHSDDFLQGLLDSGNENITVVRIDRKGDFNKINALLNDDVKKLWQNPILKYSNILSGLFHEKVVVCESDYDCLFYQSIMSAIYAQSKDPEPNILFTHCGGKNRIKDVVGALKSVGVPVVAICDFD